MTKAKKRFVELLKKLILEGDALKSVILVLILQQLVQAGRLVQKSVNGKGNLKFYQVVCKGQLTDIVLAVLDSKAKLISEVAVEIVKDYTFHYTGGNLRTRYDGKNVCLEKIIMSKVTGQTVNQLMTLDVHHMWFRFSALPEMLKMMTRVDHKAGHKKIVNYARNQVVFIDSVENWDEFISVVIQYREVLKNKTFSIEY